MKHFLLAAGLAGTLPAAQAQAPAAALPVSRTIGSVGSFGLAPNVGIQVERRLSPHFSIGLRGSRYWADYFPGYQAALLGRYYFQPTAPTGFYVQAQATLLQHNVLTYGEFARFRIPRRGAGAGLALGYQVLAGRRLAVGLSMGAKLNYLRGLNTHDFWGYNYLSSWRALGQPGSVLDGQLSVGYAF